MPLHQEESPSCYHMGQILALFFCIIRNISLLNHYYFLLYLLFQNKELHLDAYSLQKTCQSAHPPQGISECTNPEHQELKHQPPTSRLPWGQLQWPVHLDRSRGCTLLPPDVIGDSKRLSCQTWLVIPRLTLTCKIINIISIICLIHIRHMIGISDLIISILMTHWCKQICTTGLLWGLRLQRSSDVAVWVWQDLSNLDIWNKWYNSFNACNYYYLISRGFIIEAQISENVIDQMKEALVNHWNLLDNSSLCRVPVTKEGSQNTYTSTIRQTLTSRFEHPVMRPGCALGWMSWLEQESPAPALCAPPVTAIVLWTFKAYSQRDFH